MISIQNSFFEERLKVGNEFFYHIVIENPSVYRSFVKQLDDAITNGENCFEAKENGNNVELSSVAILIKDPLFIDLDEKKLSTTIQKNIAAGINETEVEGFKKIIKEIGEWITAISLGYDVPISFNDNISPAALLKTFSVSSCEYEYDFVESFVYQIKTAAMVFNKKLFIVLNAQDTFWSHEMEIVFKELNRHGISIIFCSGHCSKDFSESERIILIDKDLAELHLHE